MKGRSVLNDRLRRQLMVQRIADDARALCRGVAIQALRAQASREVRDLEDVRKALAILEPSLDTLETEERELVATAGNWLVEGR